jgi:beta-N-acetylhexosaminidase
LQGSGFTEIPSALTQGSWSQAKLESRTRTWAAALAKAGISMDLAPVADTVTATRAPNNPPIGRFRREYGQNTQDVESAVTAVVHGLASEQVLATVKHFPGLGRVRYNTDTSTGATDLVTTASDIYLQPFLAGIRAGAGAVMVSSASYPKLDQKNIAAFSAAIITGLLRERLGYTGVVISDDLGQAKAVTSVPVGQRAVRFVRAGGDIVLSVRTSDARTMRDALVAEARSSPAFKTMLDAAVIRVLKLKEQSGLLVC